MATDSRRTPPSRRRRRPPWACSPRRPRLLALGRAARTARTLCSTCATSCSGNWSNGGLPDDRDRERLPDGPGRGRLRHLGHGHPRRGDGARDSASGWGASAANRELVRWIRAYNNGRPAAEQVRFAGFDGPLEITAAASPRQALHRTPRPASPPAWTQTCPCTTETLDRLIGADGRWTDPAAMTGPAASVGHSAEAGELRLLADDLVTLLDAPGPAPARGVLTGRLGPGAPVRPYRRPACCRYHHGMADPSPARHDPADERAGRDDGPQPPRRSPLAGPAFVHRPQLPSPAGPEQDADGRPAGGVVERRW
ncbi:hypothetical protein SGLAM104S_05597 [Streptomyces glaucescens]